MAQFLKSIMRSKQKYYILGSAVVVVLISYFGYESTNIVVETTVVAQGEFIIDVLVPGELRAHQSEIITVPTSIRGELQIVDIVPEGEDVEAGDWLIKFDVANLENELIDEEEDLVLKKQELDELLVQIMADSVQREADLEIQRLTFEQKELSFKLAEFQPENTKRQMQIDMQKAELQLFDKIDQVERSKRDDRRKLRRKLDDIKRQLEDIDEVMEQIAHATLYAPIPGLVVYKKRRTGQTEERIKRGDTVHRRQELIELPDMREMLVRTSVNEVDISKIKLKQEVIITLDATSDVFYGTISYIAKLAKRESTSLGNSIKVFEVEVAIENTDESLLKPGMSATCKIITDRLENATFVPIQSVFEDEEANTFVYVKNGLGYDRTVVKVGQKNSTFITIVEGLEAGQLITLLDPTMTLLQIGKDVKDEGVVQVTPQQPSSQGAPNMQQMYREMYRRGGMGSRGRGGDASH